METINSKNPRNKQTGYKGIGKTPNGKFQATLMIRVSNGKGSNLVKKQRHIGTYDTLEEALTARVDFITLLF